MTSFSGLAFLFAFNAFALDANILAQATYAVKLFFINDLKIFLDFYKRRATMNGVRGVMQISTINERIAEVIRISKLTKTAFAEKINVSQAMISLICSGKTGVSDRTIADICRVFGITETWLRTGEGEMRQQRSREEEIGEIAERASTVDPEKARAFFQHALDGFSDAEIMAIYQIMRQRFPEK